VKGNIDTARAPRLGTAIMRDQPEGWDADESENKIERQKVGGDEDAETADQRQQPADCKELGIRLAPHIGDGIGAGGDPEQCYDGEQHCPRCIEQKAHRERWLLERQWRAADRQQRAR
jgi:hypothetical protein